MDFGFDQLVHVGFVDLQLLGGLLGRLHGVLHLVPQPLQLVLPSFQLHGQSLLLRLQLGFHSGELLDVLGHFHLDGRLRTALGFSAYMGDRILFLQQQ